MGNEKIIEGILFSSDKALLQPEVIHRYLSTESYWAQGIPMKIVLDAIKGSECFGAYSEGKQIAFARVTTDGATFAYLQDVFVLEEFRAKGISKHLIEFIMSQLPVKQFRRFMLATKDSHSLYEKFGFKSIIEPERFMELHIFKDYQQLDSL
jgi:GNAT superfamily N-acetyltransferase